MTAPPWATRWAAKVLLAAVLVSLGGFTATSQAGAREVDEPIADTWATDAPLLAIGVAGPAVTTWQAAMNTWLDTTSPDSGFRLEIDGIYGRLTDSTTRQFQFAQGLPVDGLVGPATRAAFLSAPELIGAGRSPVAHEPFLALGDRGDEVASWQTGLNRWIEVTQSRDPLTVDGIYGPATRAATETFQISQNITVDGLAGPETRAALASAPALVNVAPTVPSGVQTPRPAEQPAAGVCSRNDDPIAELVLGPDVPTPRCLSMPGDHWLRIVNNGGATHLVIGAWATDLAAGATTTSPLPVAAYLGSGAHVVAVSRYGGSGPDLIVR